MSGHVESFTCFGAKYTIMWRFTSMGYYVELHNDDWDILCGKIIFDDTFFMILVDVLQEVFGIELDEAADIVSRKIGVAEDWGDDEED